MIRTVAAAALAIAVLSACNPMAEPAKSGSAPAADSATPQSTTTPANAGPKDTPATGLPRHAGAPQAPPKAGLVLSPNGIGPYVIGSRPSADLLGTSTPIDPKQCPDLYSVQATGRYAGTLTLTLRSAVLIEITTNGGEPVQTPEGAKVGMTFAQVAKIYGKRGHALVGEGGARGYIVESGRTVTLFQPGPPQRPGVGGIAVGVPNHTKKVFVDGSPC